MSGYSESALLRKLAELKISAPSIQVGNQEAKHISIALLPGGGIVDHAPQEALQGNCPYLVKYLDVPVFKIRFIFRYRHLVAAQSGHKLTLLYLANDVVQNCRKKQPEIEAEFGLVMKKVEMTGLSL